MNDNDLLREKIAEQKALTAHLARLNADIADLRNHDRHNAMRASSSHFVLQDQFGYHFFHIHSAYGVIQLAVEDGDILRFLGESRRAIVENLISGATRPIESDTISAAVSQYYAKKLDAAAKLKNLANLPIHETVDGFSITDRYATHRFRAMGAAGSLQFEFYGFTPRENARQWIVLGDSRATIQDSFEGLRVNACNDLEDATIRTAIVEFMNRRRDDALEHYTSSLFAASRQA